jgi:dTDP-4-dehydrorhamnose reductase
MKRILVTGSSGLLGSKTVNEAGSKYEVYPTHATLALFPNSLKMNVTDESEVRHVISLIKPDVVVHTAAETNVDKCEDNKAYASRVNVEGTKHLAKICNQLGTRIIFISTDYVFDGEKGLYAETDSTNPINHYGVTKLFGEQCITKLCSDFAILRTSVLYGLHPKKQNFARWVISNLKKESQLAIVEDHYNSPTLAKNLAKTILEIIDKDIKGLYHVTGGERISRYEFALRIAETFDFDTALIRPVKMSELKMWIATRPKDSSLRVDKIRREIDTKLLGVSQGLKEVRQEWEMKT